MKSKHLTLLIMSVLLLCDGELRSQVPEGFTFQAVARNATGTLLVATDLTVRLSVHQGAADGTLIWAEEHQTSSSETGQITLVVGDPLAVRTGGTVPVFSAIHWENGPHYLEIQVDDGNGFTDLGTTPVWAVPYAMASKSLTQPVNSLRIENLGSLPEGEPLFEVKNSKGIPVFAVYEEGVWVFIDTAGTKGAKGGFAVGGYSTSKGLVAEYLRVTPDSVRIYIDPLTTKGSKGGFAVGGYGGNKAIPGYEYLKVTPDSIRVYIDDRPEIKGPKGGFAVGGYGGSKSYSQYFNISGQSQVDRITSENRVLWYPRKNAFMTGKVLIEAADSVGENSLATGFESRAIGMYSEALGYRSIARGNYSTAMGRQALAHADNAFAFGYSARAVAPNSYAFGAYALASGDNSFAFGSSGIDTLGTVNLSSLTKASGDNSFAIGMGSFASGMGAFAIGIKDTASGALSLAIGTESAGTGKYSMALGYRARATDRGALALGFDSHAGGPYSVALGFGNRADGYGATAMGYLSKAEVAGSTSLGYATSASGYSSTALGFSSRAAGNFSTSSGLSSEALGDASFSAGKNTIANSYGSFVIGQYNDTIKNDRANWVYSEPLLIAGNGPDENLRHNALVLYKDGNLWLSGSLTEASDRRLKRDLQPVGPVLAKLGEIQAVSFEYIPDRGYPAGRQVGFVAQEVADIFPELVRESPDSYLSVDYGRMTAILLEAVNEQQKMIEQLRNELDALKADIDQ